MPARRFLLFVLLAITLMNCSNAEAKELITIVHTVRDGETLDTIAQIYLPADRAASGQAFASFMEGIYEYNYESVFLHRRHYEVREGDRLMITFWQ